MLYITYMWGAEHVCVCYLVCIVMFFAHNYFSMVSQFRSGDSLGFCKVYACVVLQLESTTSANTHINMLSITWCVCFNPLHDVVHNKFATVFSRPISYVDGIVHIGDYIIQSWNVPSEWWTAHRTLCERALHSMARSKNTHKLYIMYHIECTKSQNRTQLA